jgi:ppGpp synthetase/RelA/SpoT-type nucleotidyltranferase
MDFIQYEKNGRSVYAQFSKTVAAILTAAIQAEQGYRLQQITHRAKQPASLKNKLADRNLTDTQVLEEEIKDLAGCRVVFYTNNDVSKFINSGIVNENFSIVDAKIHHPRRGSQSPTERYISNHFVVTLRPERAALPEYAEFAELRCEVQIQTILNHAWAEMAHDTIYKKPFLENFGTKMFDNIEERLRKISDQYLLPAGYEFQRIASDFERLMEGKELFERDALALIVEAPNNNARADALRSFSESVLPLYDNPQEEYTNIVEQLLIAAERSCAVEPVDIETPYGDLPAKTASDILKAIVNILSQYRYLDVNITFDALCGLYGRFNEEADEKALFELGKALSKHDMRLWKDYGPAVQILLLDLMEALNDAQRRGMHPLLLVMLTEILGVEVTATTSDSSTITWHQGVVMVSAELRMARGRAVALLKMQYELVQNSTDRYSVLQALQSATRLPMRGHGNELIRMVLEDSEQVIAFHIEKISDLEFDKQQSAENWVNRFYLMFRDLPESMRSDAGLVDAADAMSRVALVFRDEANVDGDFVIYKVLIGFNSVYPPGWDSERFQYEQAEQYRNQQVDKYLGSINADSSDVWFDRVERFSKTESNDLATFPVFGRFLERWAASQPDFMLGKLDGIEGSIARFLPAILAGLMESEQYAATFSMMEKWLDAGRHIDHIVWFLRSADTVNSPFLRRSVGGLLRRSLISARRLSDSHAMRNVVIASATQFSTNPTRLLRSIFLAALGWLASQGDSSWVRIPWFSWRNNALIGSLDEAESARVLVAMLPFPFLEYASEDIVAAIAIRWPALAIQFLGDRQVFAKTEEAPLGYDAVPFTVHSLREPLAAAPDLLLEGARLWFDAAPLLFTYDGGRLIATTFPNLEGLEVQLQTLIDTGEDDNLSFVLQILCAYDGRACVDSFVQSILIRVAVDHPLVDHLRSVYGLAGVVSGEFGFVDLHVDRRNRIAPWLRDESDSVRVFAEQLICEIDQQIAVETRSAEASIAMRKLQYGEDLGQGRELDAQELSAHHD